MGEHKGYEISTTLFLPNGPRVFEVGYCVRQGGEIVHHAPVPGPFDSMRDAESAGELAARGWIDQQGK